MMHITRDRLIKTFLFSFVLILAFITCTLAILNRPVSLKELYGELYGENGKVVKIELRRAGVNPLMEKAPYRLILTPSDSEFDSYLTLYKTPFLQKHNSKEETPFTFYNNIVGCDPYAYITFFVQEQYSVRPFTLRMHPDKPLLLHDTKDGFFLSYIGDCALLDPDYITALIDQKGMSANERKALYE